MQSWVEETGIDGFNLSRVVTPEGLEDFVDLVVPILQERGIYKTSHAPAKAVRRHRRAFAGLACRRISPVSKGEGRCVSSSFRTSNDV